MAPGGAGGWLLKCHVSRGFDTGHNLSFQDLLPHQKMNFNPSSSKGRCYIARFDTLENVISSAPAYPRRLLHIYEFLPKPRLLVLQSGWLGFTSSCRDVVACVAAMAYFVIWLQFLVLKVDIKGIYI